MRSKQLPIIAGVMAIVAAASAAACSSDDENPNGGRRRGDDDPNGANATSVVPEATDLLAPDAYGATSSMRRQTRAELRGTLIDIFGVDPGPTVMDLLPADITGPETENPFDNDATLQDVSTDLVVRLNGFAAQYSAAVIKAPGKIYEIGRCTPADANDAACFDKIVRSIGRLAFRRAITDDEAKRFAEFMTYAKEDSSFLSAIDGFVQVIVQHPEFLYRMEGSGKPTNTPNVFELSGNEIATRLAFLAWGRAPDALLLDAAESGALATATGRREQAERLLNDPRSRDQWGRFHAQWLGYVDVALPQNVASDMKDETQRLINLVVFEEKRPWLDMFRLDKTYVTPALASHYGMTTTPAARGAWIPYEIGRGGGILSHGDFLLQGSKFGDTSPTLRGYRLVKRALCKELGVIPPGVDTDNPPPGPGPNACKPQRYTMRDTNGCAHCHQLTDNIGFGLENFGPSGEWRTTESKLPSCAIDGKGSAFGKSFSGAKELGDILASQPELATCADRQLFRFVNGRADGAEDAKTLKALDAQLAAVKDLGSMVRALVETPALTHRVERSTP
jgi:hypothetical protein